MKLKKKYTDYIFNWLKKYILYLIKKTKKGDY